MRTRPDNGSGLREELARHDATGELLFGSRVNELIARVDRYLQAIARLRPGRDEAERGTNELGKELSGSAPAMTGERERARRRWPVA